MATESNASLRNVSQMARKDAVELTRRRRNGSPTARSRAPLADQTQVCAWNAATRDSRAAAATQRH
eukprot:2295481-Lingulodinium_polyedra.AAC.1